MAAIAELPIIDLAKAKSNRKELAAKVIHALENIGFLYIDNVEGLNCDLLHKCCEWFFNQPDEVKRKLTRKQWNPENSNVYKGYFPVVPGEPSRKEAFEFSRDVDPKDPTVAKGNWFYEASIWPPEEDGFPFKKILQEAYETAHKTGLEILRLTAIGLGIEENALAELFEDKPLSTFRLLHYPPWVGAPPKAAIIEDGRVVTTPDHTDTDFMALLTTFHYKGLEVMTTSGEWAKVLPRPNSLVMNIGDAFSRMMGGRFKATRHRVMDIGADRFSVPFFLSPGFDTDIGINFMSKYEEGGPAHVYERYGPWVLHTMKHQKKYFEYKVLPEFDLEDLTQALHKK